MDHVLPLTEQPLDKDDRYDYVEPYRSADKDITSYLIDTLAKTTTFRRLNDIRFLGALDYSIIANPNGTVTNVRYTRAQHSIGVAALARAYLALSPHSLRDQIVCVASAMLHDIGHAPFSHTLEPVFRESFGLDHHTVSEDIIRGKVERLSDAHNVLRRFGLNAEEIIDVLNGNDSKFDDFFSGPINFDTIEGILRSRSYFKMESLGLTPFKVVKAATVRSDMNAQNLVDSFWQCKDEMYNVVIRSQSGVVRDTLFQEIARNSKKLSPADFYSTEWALFHKIPDLRRATKRDEWFRVATEVLPKEIRYQSRSFFVDKRASFLARDDGARYQQTKRPSVLTLKEISSA